MGILRRHHDELGTRYQMREKLVASATTSGSRTPTASGVFKVNGKALRVRRHARARSRRRAKSCSRSSERKLSVRDKMDRSSATGDTVATVKKALISPLRERFDVELEDGGELEAKGNIVDHEYEIERDGHKVAEVSKRWFRVRDTYGIEVAPGRERRARPRGRPSASTRWPTTDGRGGRDPGRGTGQGPRGGRHRRCAPSQ